MPTPTSGTVTEGFTFPHASIIRRVLDLFGPDHGLLQYGIRSGTREEFALIETLGSRVSEASDLMGRLRKEGDRPMYLTLDLDFFDPSFVPGVGTPEPGGESFASFVDIMKQLRGHNFVGAGHRGIGPTH